MELGGHVGVVIEELAGLFAANAQPGLLVGEGRTGLGDQPAGQAEVKQAPRGVQAVVEPQVQLGGAEGDGDLSS